MDRAAIHHRAAADLADRDDELEVAARAHHALAALPLGDPADAVALATAAGDRARDRLAFDEAARWYRRAHDAASADSAIGPRARAELLLAEGSALRSVASPRAEDVLAEAAVAADGMGDMELLRRVVVTWTYRHGGAIVFGPRLRPWIARALEAPPGHDVALQARVVGAAAIVACFDDPTRAWELLSVAQELAASAARRPRDLGRCHRRAAPSSGCSPRPIGRWSGTGTDHQRPHGGPCPADARRGRAGGRCVLASPKSRCAWATCRAPSRP